MAYFVEGVEHVVLVAHELPAPVFEFGGVKGPIQTREEDGFEAYWRRWVGGWVTFVSSFHVLGQDVLFSSLPTLFSTHGLEREGGGSFLGGTGLGGWVEERVV